MAVADHHLTSECRYRGVYRYRKLIDGRAAWYAVNAAGEMSRVETASAIETDAQVVTRLRHWAYGDRVFGPHLTVSDGGALRARPLLPSVAARVYRARLAAQPAPTAVP